MNREQLKELGLTDEQIDAVMREHGKTVTATKEQLDAATTERDSLKEQIGERDTQLESLKEQVKDNAEFTAEIDRLKTENEAATTELQEKLSQQAFGFALEQRIMQSKARNPKAVKALLDMEKIKLDGETLIGYDDQETALKESDAYLFESEEETTPPAKPNFSTGEHNKEKGELNDIFQAKLAKYE